MTQQMTRPMTDELTHATTSAFCVRLECRFNGDPAGSPIPLYFHSAAGLRKLIAANAPTGPGWGFRLLGVTDRVVSALGAQVSKDDAYLILPATKWDGPAIYTLG